MEVKRTERGWPGHYILGDRCVYHRNTLLECGKKRIIVSTVGNLRMKDKTKAELISCSRYYETMAFRAKYEKPYWEINVSRPVKFASPWAIERMEHGTDLEADAMHEAVVDEITRIMTRKGG